MDYIRLSIFFLWRSSPPRAYENNQIIGQILIRAIIAFHALLNFVVSDLQRSEQAVVQTNMYSMFFIY